MVSCPGMTYSMETITTRIAVAATRDGTLPKDTSGLYHSCTLRAWIPHAEMPPDVAEGLSRWLSI